MLRVPGWIQRHFKPMLRAGEVLDGMCDLPFVNCRGLFSNAPVLILAPHPDDETFGCGGLIAECCRQNLDVHVLILTDGSGSHPRSREYPAPRLTELRKSEARAALGRLGLPMDRVGFLAVKDGTLARYAAAGSRVVADVVHHARERNVGTILTTWQHDPHPDHRAAWRIGMHAARELGIQPVCYPVWGWTIPRDAWLPLTPVFGARLDITRHLPLKRQAIACYRSQISDLIDDDPGAFRMAPEVLAQFERPFEVLLTTEARAGHAG